MVNPIGPGNIPLPNPTAQGESLQKLQKPLDAFIEDLYNLKRDPSLSVQPEFIDRVHAHVNALRTTTENILGLKE